MERSFFEWVSFLLDQYGNLFLRGTINTIIIAILGTVFGFFIGMLVAVLKTIPVESGDSKTKKFFHKAIDILLNIYIQVLRGTPMIVQSMLFYYGALQYFNIDIPSMPAAIIIVSVNTGAYMAEIIRGGIISIDSGQIEGALSIGMTHWQAMTNVVMPQAVRNIIPSVGNEFIVNIKDSSVLNMISVSELFFVSKSAAGTYLRYFESFFIAACIYLFLTLTISKILEIVEKRMDGPDSYTIHGSQSDFKATIKTGSEG
ncbi:MAG: amino acid ABC transporter permease [Tissierellia bacterium]|nr:amino acid ABC transporter permease [Tissierellia bacterium]